MMRSIVQCATGRAKAAQVARMEIGQLAIRCERRVKELEPFPVPAHDKRLFPRPV
jgi:hypothetical protein